MIVICKECRAFNFFVRIVYEYAKVPCFLSINLLLIKWFKLKCIKKKIDCRLGADFKLLINAHTGG